MRATSAVLIILILRTQSLWAQFDLLTPREAQRIVEQIPNVVEAAKELHCSTVADAVVGSVATIDVEVRCGAFHEYYAVNRSTGIVTLGVVENSPKVGDLDSEALAQKIVTQARSRVLSLRESRCLALEGARSLPGWNETTGSTTIVLAAAPPLPPVVTNFSLSHKVPSPSTELRVHLSVNPRTGHILNASTGAEVMSPSLGELLAILITLRSPPLLSDQDALSIAMRVPALAAILQRNGCFLSADSTFTPDEAQIASACNGRVDGQRVAVNLRNGLVSDADTGNAIDAPAARVLASRLVSAVHDRRLRLQEEFDSKCGSFEDH